MTHKHIPAFTQSPEAAHHNQRWLSRKLTWAARRTATQVVGAPAAQNVLLVPKHQNWSDPFVVGNTVLEEDPERTFVIVAKPSLFRYTVGVLPLLGVLKVERAKDDKRRSADERVAYIHDHARSFGSALVSVPHAIGMSFIEGTRIPDSIGKIRTGPLLAAAYAAQEQGAPFLVQAVGLGGNSGRALMRGGTKRSPQIAEVFADPIEVHADILMPNNGIDEQKLGMYKSLVALSLQAATNEAREIVGLPPIEAVDLL